MKDYESHIVNSLKNESFCGEKLSHLDFSLGLEQALGCIIADTRVQPCPKCLKSIIKILKTK